MHPRVIPKRHLAVVVAGLYQTEPAGRREVELTLENKAMNTKDAMRPDVYSFATVGMATERRDGVECAICKVNHWHAIIKPKLQYLNLAPSEHLKHT